MAYFTSAQLKTYEREERLVRLAESHRVTKALAGVKVFLSHSHQDVDHVKAARQLLEANGASIYVDWEDGEMPATTSTATATRLKARIRECGRFVLLASERSKSSLWVPWELGYADSEKSVSRIAILPFIAATTAWAGTEYVGLYPTIQFGAAAPVVVAAGATVGTSLSAWLTA